MNEFVSLYQDATLDVRADIEQLSAREAVVLSFTDVGLSTRGGGQQIEFIRSSVNQGGVIFVTDLARSWGNAIDFRVLAKVLAPYVDGRTVYAIGNSMGGFLAILATSFLPISVVVAFAPQWSVSPEVVPDETRWPRWRERILDFRFPSLEGHFHDRATYYAFAGGAPSEERHWRHFPNKPNVNTFVFPGVQHNIAPTLKLSGVLHELIAQAFAKSLTLESLSALYPGPVERVHSGAGA